MSNPNNAYGDASQRYTNGHSQGSWGSPFPALHMWPIQDTFVMKMIHLPESQRIKIGRQTNNKTVPGERNAYFDSKVLSRTHAEIWEQSSKSEMYIRDVKSSNGTFVNSERLSAEGVESEPYELKSEDLVEFGIDIVSEDNRTILHHKVAAKVYCVFIADDAALSARELVHYQQHDLRGARRTTGQTNHLTNAGPAVMSSGGKANGLSFDHVLHKLQSELLRSKETGAELQGLATSMTDIQDTLGGGLPPAQNGSASAYIPPQYRSASAEAQTALAGPHGQQAAAFISLQNQLTDTQSTLSNQLDKIRYLEGQVQDHESIRDELSSMRDQMQEAKLTLSTNRGRQMEREDHDDDDDSRSTITVMADEGMDQRRDRRRAEDVNAELIAKIQSLSTEMIEALQLSRSLQSQHNEAMSTVKLLTERISVIESGMASRVAQEETRWNLWRSKFEEGWRQERETWEAERERLRGVVREWEEASRRAHEEEEDRELNETLSDDSEPEPQWQDEPRPRPKRRRRPSKAQLAVRALKAIADDTGSQTPKAEAIPLKPRKLKRKESKESSESGKDSGDTLKEELPKRKRKQPIQPIPIFSVLLFAAVAGAFYYTHNKE